MNRSYIILLIIVEFVIGNGCNQQCTRREEQFNCSNMNLTSVPKNIPESITDLNLRNNRISRILKNDFIYLKLLKNLDLSNNIIKSIDDKAFECLKSLKNLNLFHNNLKFINNMTFYGLQNVQYLPLSSNYLQHIPDFGNLTNLITLDVARNHIHHIVFPSSFSFLTSLVELRLSNNKIEKPMLHSDVKYLRRHQITRFICKQCYITHFEENFFIEFVNLQELNLSNCNLSRDALQIVLNSLANVKHLLLLKLTNIITHYEITYDLLKPLANVSLEELWLTSCWRCGQLRNGTFSVLNKLKLLQLEAVELTNIEFGAFDGLNNLEELYLENNELTEYTLNLAKVLPHNIRYLSLRRNSLNYLKADVFTNLHNLQALNLSDCSLLRIDQRAFAPNNNLTEINLTRNRIFYPSKFEIEMFSQFFHLKTLILTGNNLNELLLTTTDVAIFKNLTNLKVMNLSGAYLSHLPTDIFLGLNNLTDLILSDNEISGWTVNTFKPLESLSRLNLSTNKIQLLNQTSVTYWRNNIEVDLSNNRLNCWCDMLWFRKNLGKFDNMTFIKSDEYKCGSPKKYENMKLSDIPYENLVADCSYPPWLLYVICSGCGVFLIVTLASFVANRYRWYIKWYFYVCFQGLPKRDHNEEDILASLLQENNEFDVYISYDEESDVWAELVAKKLETSEDDKANTSAENDDRQFTVSAIAPLNQENFAPPDNIVAIVSEVEQNAHNAPVVSNVECEKTIFNAKKLKVYFEKRDSAANKSLIGQLSEAIYRSRNAIIGVSSKYLEDRRRQFELDLIHAAMIERYGYAANSHILLVALENSGELMHKMPKNFRNLFSNQSLAWSEHDNVQQKLFWVKLCKSLR